MKKMVCSLLAFLLLTGCAPAVDPDLTPESIMKNALRKSEEEVQEALGVSFEGAETGAQPNYYLLECSVPFGDQVADQIEFQFYKGKLACVRYTFSALKTPEETWDFLAGMARGSRGSKGCVPPWRIPMDKGLPMTAMIPLRTSRL